MTVALVRTSLCSIRKNILLLYTVPFSLEHKLTFRRRLKFFAARIHHHQQNGTWWHRLNRHLPNEVGRQVTHEVRCLLLSSSGGFLTDKLHALTRCSGFFKDQIFGCAEPDFTYAAGNKCTFTVRTRKHPHLRWIEFPNYVIGTEEFWQFRNNVLNGTTQFINPMDCKISERGSTKFFNLVLMTTVCSYRYFAAVLSVKNLMLKGPVHGSKKNHRFYLVRLSAASNKKRRKNVQRYRKWQCVKLPLAEVIAVTKGLSKNIWSRQHPSLKVSFSRTYK